MSRTGRVVRVVAITIAAVLALSALAIWVLSERRLTQRYDASGADFVIPTDSASIARGEHLTRIATCTLCHGADLGGGIYADMGPMGVIAGSNLTTGRGGVASYYTASDWSRAIRRGVRQDSTSLIVMPSEVFTHLSGEDLAAIVGYLRARAPVDRDVPRSHFGPLGRALLAMGKLNILVAPKTEDYKYAASVEPNESAEYGRYLADITGCHGCHGYGLSGGQVAGPPGLPPASNLTPTGIGAWSEADFVRAMREGKRPDGSILDEFMPWKNYTHMTDSELRALWLYLREVPPKAFGGK
jgi:cytochrome c553